MQILLIATSCCAGPDLVSGSGGGHSCMLILPPTLTCNTNAGPAVLTFAPFSHLLCLSGPDLCTSARNWWYKEQHINMLVGKEGRHGCREVYHSLSTCYLLRFACSTSSWWQNTCIDNVHLCTRQLRILPKSENCDVRTCARHPLYMIDVVWHDAFVPVSTL